jgi:hypothetical protein
MVERASWPKSCRCGATWSEPEWRELPFVGYAENGDGGELELRNCTCGSTIAVQRETDT